MLAASGVALLFDTFVFQIPTCVKHSCVMANAYAAR